MATRYKIIADTPEGFAKAREIAESDTRVHVVSQKRLTLSTDELSDAAREQLEGVARITPDAQYDADAPA